MSIFFHMNYNSIRIRHSLLISVPWINLLQEKKAALMDIISGAEDGGVLDMPREDLLALLDAR